MESNELKEIDIKNCTCCYCDNIIKIDNFDSHNILIDEKSYKNILAYGISQKTLFDSKPLCIKFDELTNLIYQNYDGIRNLVLSGPEKYDSIYNGIMHLISQKGGIATIIYHNL